MTVGLILIQGADDTVDRINSVNQLEFAFPNYVLSELPDHEISVYQYIQAGMQPVENTYNINAHQVFLDNAKTLQNIRSEALARVLEMCNAAVIISRPFTIEELVDTISGISRGEVKVLE